MVRYIGQRVLAAVPVLLGILFVTFVLARVLPGDPCRAMLGEKATDQICDAFAERYGLNKPILIQFGVYITDVFQGDLGTSFRYGRPVTQLMVERLPVTVELSICALIFATILGVLAGMWSAYRRNSAIDVGTMVVANIGVSMPVFWLGLMLAYLFALTLKGTPFALPPSGRNSPGLIVPSLLDTWNLQLGPGALRSFFQFLSNMHLFNALITLNGAVFWDTLKHMILPAAALGTIPLAIIARMTRSSLLDVLGLDYVRTARAKGLRDRTVVLRHGMRNAMIPVVTIIGLSLGSLLGGAVLTETIFNLSGVGRILFDSIQARDFSVVQGFTLIIAAAYVLLNLLVDLLYGYLDPRVRLG